ncbi:MAG: phosphotransferase, partial [Thermoplasmata archaeon]
SSPFTKTVNKRWNELVEVFGDEVTVLVDADINDIAKVTVPVITEAIQAFREGKVIIHPGGGGRYGIIEIPSADDTIEIDLDGQKTLLDFE